MFLQSVTLALVPSFTFRAGCHHITRSGVLGPRMATPGPSTPIELTPTLIEWGVDADLWSATRNKQALLDLAAVGDEAKAKERISFLRKAVDGGHTRSNDRPYLLKGTAPAGVDTEAVQELLARRVEMKKARDFSDADAVQAKLYDMGIWVNDKTRTWEASTAATGGYTLKGEPPADVDQGAVEGMLARRLEAKRAKDFDGADAIQDSLNAMGVFVNDKKKTWESSKKSS